MTDRPTLVLVVEDDPNISDLVRANLTARGYEVVLNRDGRGVRALVEHEQPDLVLLDLNLPAADGVALCREIRTRSQVGIIVLSARRSETDKVQALHHGADDYLTKPFGIEELLARITATLRRTRPVEPDTLAGSIVRVGNVAIDLEARAVTVEDERVHLTPTEFGVLRELALEQGKVLTHAMLLRRVWGPGYETETEYTRAYVRRLRAKLENPGCERLVATEPRVGYRLTTG